MTMQMHLLDYLARRTNCLFLSDLRQLDRRRRGLLLQVLERLPPEKFPPKEWNDALRYLAGASPEETAGKARARLLALLDSPR